MTTQQIPDLAEVPLKIVQLALKRGAAPQTYWQGRIDQKWEVAVNASAEQVTVPTTSERMGADIPRFHVAVWYNGWLAGLMTPFDGVIAAGEGANEETLLAALEGALAA
jgi:hypothetical protein